MKYEIVKREQCHAITQRRDRPNEPHQHGKRCKHYTLRGIYCYQHEKTLRNFRITRTATPPKSQYGLITTVDIPMGKLICRYEGEKIILSEGVAKNLENPYLLQVKKKPSTFIDASKTNFKQEGRYVKPSNSSTANAEIIIDGEKAYIYSTKYIHAGSEIKALRQVKHTKIPIIRKTRAVLPKLSKQERIDKREEKQLLIRLQFINSLFNNQQMAQRLNLKFKPNRKIKIPKQGNLDFVNYRKKLEKEVKAQEQALLNYFKSGGQSSSITLKKVQQTVDQLIAKKKPTLRNA